MRYIAKLFISLILIIGALVVFQKQNPGQDKFQITASFYPLAEFAKQIGGERIEVKTMVPAGIEPHDYEPTPKDRALLGQADIFIFNGANLEPWLDRLLPDLAKTETINASKYILKLEQDPHFWLDPVMAQEITKGMLQKFIEIDPKNSSYYSENANNYIKKLADLDNKFKQLANCPKKDIIAPHAAFAYLAKRYGLNQVPIAGIFEQEPSPSRLAEISRFIKEKNIKYIFFETLASSKLSKTLAIETGTNILALNPIEGLLPKEKEQGENYISLMEKNLNNLKIALECKNEQ